MRGDAMKYSQYEEEYTIPKYKDDPSALMQEIRDVKKAMEAAYINFENLTEPELVDSCIYELKSIQMRYQYLLNLAKLRNVRADISFNEQRI